MNANDDGFKVIGAESLEVSVIKILGGLLVISSQKKLFAYLALHSVHKTICNDLLVESCEVLLEFMLEEDGRKSNLYYFIE